MKPWADYTDPSNWHDAANIFPLMDNDALNEMADDIKANGLKNPIILLDAKVLDGRNRLLACKLAGVRPNIESRNPDKLGSPVTWVLSQNLHRRQLTASQRAVIGMKAEKLFAIEAERRMLAGKKTDPSKGSARNQAVEKTDPKAIVPEGFKGQARDQAAKESGASHRYIQDAKAIAAKAPELITDVEAGKFTIPEAKRIAPLKITNPEHYSELCAGKRSLREVRQTLRKPRDSAATNFGEKDFYARVARGVESAFNSAFSKVDDRLKVLESITQKNWTPEAAEGIPQIIKRLTEVSSRVDAYRLGLEQVVKKINKRVA